MKIDDQEKMLEKMREIARQNPDDITIIETSVDSQIQIDFFESLQRIDENEDDVNIQALYNELICKETALDRKKEILAQLTSLGEVESYRLLEEYLKTAEDDIKTWAFLACQQGRMFLESKLLEESKIYIASGLGGKDHRLRYVFAFAAREGVYSDSQENIIRGEIEYYLKKNDGIIENIEFGEGYAICTSLVPIYVNLVELIQEIVSEINQFGNFIKENVFITNEKPVKIKELKDIFV